MSIIIAIIFTIALNLFNFFALKSFSAGIVFASMYLAPVVINAILVQFQKRKVDGRKLSVILPTLSTIGYGIYAYFATVTGSWQEFALRNTVSGENFSLEIGTELFATSDMIFIGLVFFALSGLNYIIYATSKKEVTVYA